MSVMAIQTNEQAGGMERDRLTQVSIQADIHINR
jgi:hypothetical protein